MYKLKMTLFICLLLAAVLASLAACTASPSPTAPGVTTPPRSPAAPTTTAPVATQTSTTTPKYGGIFRIIDNRIAESSVGYPPKLLGQDIDYVLPAVETLVRCDTKKNPVPWLATEWKVGADKKSITFTLRKDVKFHDGTDFNAQAVKFNLDGAIAAKLGGTTPFTTVDVIDDYTVRLNLSHWENTIYETLATFPGMMVSPTSIQKNGTEWASTHAVGTGPFTLEEFRRGEIEIFKRNPNYWQKGRPYLDGIEYICIPDTVAQVVAFKAGEAEVVNAWSAQCLSDLKAVPGTVFSYKPDGVWILYPDDADPNSPWSKLKVRQAANSCIDKDAMAKSTGFGIFEAAKVLNIPGTIGYTSKLVPSEYNVEKAKQLLAEAGYPNGFNTILTITIPAPDVKDAQVAIAGFLGKIGINCKLEYADPAKYAEYMEKGWEGIIYSPGAGDNFLGAMRMYYATPGYYVDLKGPDNIEDLINAALATDSVEPAKVEAIAIAMNEYVGMIPIQYMGTGWAIKPYVHDLGRLEHSNWRVISWEQAWMDKK